MKRWFGMLIILLAPAALGGGSYNSASMESGDLDKEVIVLADWKTVYEPPVGHYRFHKVMLCQRLAYDRRIEPRSCYPLVWARSLVGGPGFIQADTSETGVAVRNANEWYRVNPKWNRRLVNHFRALEYRAVGQLFPGEQVTPAVFAPRHCQITRPLAMPDCS